jgi:hypothetical protein
MVTHGILTEGLDVGRCYCRIEPDRHVGAF